MPFVLDLPPVPAPANVAQPNLAFRVTAVEDQRVDKSKMGERFAAFRVKMGDVTCSQSLPQYVWEVLVQHLQGTCGRSVESNGIDELSLASSTAYPRRRT